MFRCIELISVLLPAFYLSIRIPVVDYVFYGSIDLGLTLKFVLVVGTNKISLVNFVLVAFALYSEKRESNLNITVNPFKARIILCAVPILVAE